MKRLVRLGRALRARIVRAVSVGEDRALWPLEGADEPVEAPIPLRRPAHDPR